MAESEADALLRADNPARLGNSCPVVPRSERLALAVHPDKQGEDRWDARGKLAHFPEVEVDVRQLEDTPQLEESPPPVVPKSETLACPEARLAVGE